MLETSLRRRNLYTISKKQTAKGLVWYARFWDEKSQKYSVARSTSIITNGMAKIKTNKKQINFFMNSS